ncbi:unnamed protein product [Psylliodes chrysocephalus]|uniref:Mitochondrial assembly of ribosomal large subunit protein 1 n=1 Tax=Psylliodes chrysocephalus TaxID=3402493 RepID=A0A9P0D344_9CUCU|nr:unnamed protein product [Psylliodes chrysocephala]
MIPSFRCFSRLIKPRPVSFCPCKTPALSVCRNKSKKVDLNTQDQETLESKSLGNMSSKYQVYHDEDSEIILDVYEERLKYSQLAEENEEVDDRYTGLNLKRGITGVFDIEDLVEVLKREKGKDIFVVAVPKEINYVDYICIVSGNSSKHMQAVAQFVRRMYKQKRDSKDDIPKLEGENSKDWMALDLGNIALHIFSEEARALYDLETLWSVGAQYDGEYNKPEPVSDMLKKHSVYLNGLEPAS